MSTEVLLEAQDLSYAIAGKLIIHNISLSLRRGEIVRTHWPQWCGEKAPYSSALWGTTTMTECYTQGGVTLEAFVGPSAPNL